jgi:hypothetical protein
MWNVVTEIHLGPFTVLIYISQSQYILVGIFRTERLQNETKM